MKDIYVKFKMDNKRKLMRSLIISERREFVDDWTGNEPKEEQPERKTEATERGLFSDISREFERSLVVFQKAIPFFLSSFPMMMRFMDDSRIRGFVGEHGKLIGDGEYETYSIDETHLGRILNVLDDMHANQSGLGALPNMFLVGLVSVYDVFLSQVIRGYFLTNPEAISSSDRNLSFKDLVEIGTIEAARERIIEKEIETVMRKNHVDQISWLESKLNMPLRKDLAVWPDFVELCERRNLLTIQVE